MNETWQHHRFRATTGLTVVGLAFCALFWIGEPSWNREIFGRYSLKWFGGGVIANLLILVVLMTRLRRIWTAQVPVTSARKSSSVQRKICFAAITVLPTLIVTELALRHFFFPPPPRPYRPEAGASGGYHATLQHVERIHENGKWVRAYRGRTYTHQRTTTFRILCLGGSTTWGHHLEPEQTWPRMLEQRLMDLGYDAEVINAGRSWYTTVHSITNYTTHMRYYDPDVVVVMHGANDVARSFPGPGEPPAEWDYGSYQGPMRNVLAGYRANNRRARLADWHPGKLVRSSAIFRLAFDRLKKQDRREDEEVGLEAFATLDAYRMHLEYLTRLCLDDHVAVLLTTQAHIYDRDDLSTLPCFDSTMRETYMKTTNDVPISASSLRQAMRVVRECVFDVARAQNLPVADVQRAVGGNVKYFMDDFHFTPEGNAVTAQVVLKQLRPILDEMLTARALVGLGSAQRGFENNLDHFLEASVKENWNHEFESARSQPDRRTGP